jgi:hypothetical protein
MIQYNIGLLGSKRFFGLPRTLLEAFTMNLKRMFIVCSVMALLLSFGAVSPAFSQLHASYSPPCDLNVLPNQPLHISVVPYWDLPSVGYGFGYRLYRGPVEMVNIFLYEPQTYSTSFTPSQSPAGAYRHFGEYNAMKFENVYFTLTREWSSAPQRP